MGATGTAANDLSRPLAEAVRAAAEKSQPLAIAGGNTKRFYGRRAEGTVLDVSGHRGVVSYEPTELVITARAGTPLIDIEQTLAAQGQMLGFEPPHFAAGATLGGTIACGFSGPRRLHVGAARDFVLGTTIVNGRGEILRFGGEVMKNVAGYDVSRLMVGALGTLGVILDVSLKLLPLPAHELTLAFAFDAATALRNMNAWAREALPITGACHARETLYVRLSGSQAAVRSARGHLGGEETDGGFWRELRDHRLDFFGSAAPLWRLAVPPAAPILPLRGSWLLDWGGAQRWLTSAAPADEIRQAAARVGGHATLFRGGDRTGEVFQPPAPALATIQRNIKRAFDPAGVLNVGRLCAAW